MGRPLKLVGSLCLSCLASACGDATPKSDDTKDTKTSGGGHTVMVIDDGFDSSHPVFEDKIVGKYTVVCPEDDSSDGSDDLSFSELKTKVLKDLQSDDGDCSIKSGISFSKGSDIDQVAEYRDEWNAGILKKQGMDLSDGEIEKIDNALSGASANKNYHGTNTAGVIAYQNPSVRLVLLQFELGKSGDSVTENENDCPTQKSLDTHVKVLEDEEVRRAYIERPPAGSTKALVKIAGDHGVSIVNLSFGSLARATLERQLKDENCGSLNLSDSYRVEGELEYERDQYYQDNYAEDFEDNILGVFAAGNSGERIDSFADTDQCDKAKDGSVSIGSIDRQGKRSKFSNYGECVNYYMLGESVVVAAPGGFLNVVDGTSFSAPLTVRYLSQNVDTGVSANKMVSALDKIANSQGYLSTNSYPEELAFENKDSISSYTLKSSQKKKATASYRSLHKIEWIRRLSK
jgi:hypothetical protein